MIAVWLMLATSPDVAVSQTLTAVRYGSMAECSRAAAQIVLHDTGKRPVTVTVRPYCTDVKPQWWKDMP